MLDVPNECFLEGVWICFFLKVQVVFRVVLKSVVQVFGQCPDDSETDEQIIDDEVLKELIDIFIKLVGNSNIKNNQRNHGFKIKIEIRPNGFILNWIIIQNDSSSIINKPRSLNKRLELPISHLPNLRHKRLININHPI